VVVVVKVKGVLTAVVQWTMLERMNDPQKNEIKRRKTYSPWRPLV